MRSVHGVGRIAALGAVLLAVLLLALILFSGGSGYTVTLKFENASQLVAGNIVQVGGNQAGTVKGIDVARNGQAEVEISVDDRYAPLPRGTKAVIRQASLSGIANRYVDLQRPGGADSDGSNMPKIDDGGEIPVAQTASAVDLDQLFNVFDPVTRVATQDFFKGSAAQYAGIGEQVAEGVRYFNPAVSTTARLFQEIARDQPQLERFVIDSARLVGAAAEREDDLTNLITNLNQTTAAIGAEKEALASAIEQLPPFMRRSNSTFVNLRSALDDVDPLVEASKPVAAELDPFLDDLRPFARDVRPVVRDLSNTVRRRGPRNDLIDLTRTGVPLADIALLRRAREIDFGTGAVNVGETAGAFPETARALIDTVPIIAQGRPYTPELFGWFDGFSHPGLSDALGGFLRSQVYFNAADLSNLTGPTLIPLAQRGDALRDFLKTRHVKRCPGGADAVAPDGSNVLSEEEQRELDCLESHRATSNIRR